MLKPKKVHEDKCLNDLELTEQEMADLHSLAEIISNYLVREMEKNNYGKETIVIRSEKFCPKE